MGYIDPLVNAGKVDLLGGKSGGIFHNLSQLGRPEAYKRSMLNANGAKHSQFDFLKSMGPCADRVSVFRPVASVTETRFHRGFHRRLLQDRDAARECADDLAWARFNFKNRRAIERHERTKRNVLTGDGIASLHHAGKKCEPSMRTQFDLSRSKEAFKRNMNNEGRFFLPPRPRSFSSTPCETMVLGCSGARRRNRANSAGVFDNFGHTQKPLVIVNHSTNTRNVSQIVLL
jgi:hypothetical protein